MCDTEDQGINPGAGASEGLACIAGSVNQSEVFAQQLEDVRNPAGNERTHIPGVYLYDINARGRTLHLVRVELDEYPQTTVQELARAVGLSTQLVFSRILDWSQGPNRHIASYWYRRYINGNASELDEKIFSLRDASGGVSAENIPHYSRWGLPNRANYRLLLPRSQSFEDAVATRRTQLLSGELTALADRLSARVEDALEIARRLTDNTNRLAQHLGPYEQEAGTIELMRQFLEIAKETPAEAYSSSERSEFDQLIDRVEALSEAAATGFKQEPTSEIARLRAHIERDTLRLNSMLETRSELNRLLQEAQLSGDMMTASFMQDISRKLGACYSMLSQSSQGETFVLQTLSPLLQAIIDNAGISTDDSVITQLAHATQSLGLFVGNIPGPPSVMMVVIESSLPVMIRLGAGNPDLALRLQNQTVRVLGRLLGLSDELQTQFFTRMTTGNAQGIMDTRGWTERMVNSEVQGSPAWGAALAIINGLLLLNALTSLATTTTDSMATRIRLLADVTSTGANFYQSLVVALQNSERINNIAPAAMAGSTLRVIGLVGAIAATVSSTVVMIQEYETRDYTGLRLAGMGMLSGLFTIAGFVAWMAIGGSAVPPVAAVLFIIALVLSLVAWLISWLTADTDCDLFFEGMVESLSDESTRFAVYLRSHGDLRSRYEAVRIFHHTVTIQELQNSARDALEALLGYDQVTEREAREQTRELIDAMIA